MNNSKGDNIITDFINKEIDREIDVVESGVDIEFQKYCKMYEERFNKKAYIAEPGGTKEKTIEAIKKCLKKDKDILDKLLYPKVKKKWLL